MFASIFNPGHEIHNHAVIGVRNVHKLNEVLRVVKENNIAHYAFIEPDNDFGFTALVTEPLAENDERRNLFKRYKLLDDENEDTTRDVGAAKAVGDLQYGGESPCSNGEDVRA